MSGQPIVLERNLLTTTPASEMFNTEDILHKAGVTREDLKFLRSGDHTDLQESLTDLLILRNPKVHNLCQLLKTRLGSDNVWLPIDWIKYLGMKFVDQERYLIPSLKMPWSIDMIEDLVKNREFFLFWVPPFITKPNIGQGTYCTYEIDCMSRWSFQFWYWWGRESWGYEKKERTYPYITIPYPANEWGVPSNVYPSDIAYASIAGWHLVRQNPLEGSYGVPYDTCIKHIKKRGWIPPTMLQEALKSWLIKIKAGTSCYDNSQQDCYCYTDTGWIDKNQRRHFVCVGLAKSMKNPLHAADITSLISADQDNDSVSSDCCGIGASCPQPETIPTSHCRE